MISPDLGDGFMRHRANSTYQISASRWHPLILRCTSFHWLSAEEALTIGSGKFRRAEQRQDKRLESFWLTSPLNYSGRQHTSLNSQDLAKQKLLQNWNHTRTILVPVTQSRFPWFFFGIAGPMWLFASSRKRSINSRCTCRLTVRSRGISNDSNLPDNLCRYYKHVVVPPVQTLV